MWPSHLTPRASTHASALSRGRERGGGGIQPWDVHTRCQPGPRHIRATLELWCTPVIWQTYFDFRSNSILGNLLQTISPQSTFRYISQKTQSRTAASDLVKDKTASARAEAWGLTDFQRVSEPGSGRDVPLLGPWWQSLKQRASECENFIQAPLKMKLFPASIFVSDKN